MCTTWREHRSESVFLGRDYNKTKDFYDQVALQIDQEVKKIIEGCYSEAKKIVAKEKKLIDILAKTLIEKETLTKEEIETLVEQNSDYKIAHDDKKEKEEDSKSEEKDKKSKKQDEE